MTSTIVENSIRFYEEPKKIGSGQEQITRKNKIVFYTERLSKKYPKEI